MIDCLNGSCSLMIQMIQSYEYSYLLYAITGLIWSIAFMFICIGISYLRTSNHHYSRYDSDDFIDDENDDGE